ncbi:MAG: CBS domain-containing protein [Saprospiraceae bacterium]|nr:CBS domain-containing protein [Saprospiraceae bacterium]MDW8229444.1 CBS domain-containing protein [Saprospiraceae bacterium]
MMNETIDTIMSTKLITLTPDDTLGKAREILMTKRIHHLPVVEGKKLVGMITAWDMFKIGKSADEYQHTKVRDVMTTKLATLEPHQHIGAAAEVLMEHLFHAIPIVNDEGHLVGIITSYDILRYSYNKEYPENLEKFIPENM